MSLNKNGEPYHKNKFCSITKCRHSKLNMNKIKNDANNLAVSFHRVPQNKEIRQIWFDFMKKYDNSERISVSSFYLCNDHFEECCFSRDLKSELLYNKPKLVLNSFSAPTIYLKSKKEPVKEIDTKSQTIEDILKEYEGKTEDFLKTAYKNIHSSRIFCCILNCKSDNKTSKLYSVEKYNLLNKIPKALIVSNSKMYICIDHFEKKYLDELQIFRKHSDSTIKQIIDYDLVNNAIPTVFKDHTDFNNASKEINYHEDEIELDIDKLIPTGKNTEQIQIFDLPELINDDANILARKKICRVCFRTNNEILEKHNLGSFKKVQNDLKFQITEIGKLFEKILDLKVLDLPCCMNICTTCQTLLESSANFKMKASNSNKRFLEIFDNFDWIDMEIKKIDLIEAQRHKPLRKKELELQHKINNTVKISESRDVENKSFNNIDMPTTSILKVVVPKESVEKKISFRSVTFPKLVDQKCPYCPRILTSLYFLKLHIERIHNANTIENRTCKICNKILASMRGLRHHNLTVHTETYKVFCEYCGKGFKTITSLNIHKLVHTNIRKHVCNIPECGKTFKRRTHLLQHLFYHRRSNLKQTGTIVKDICDICKKRISSSFMNAHKATHLQNCLTVDPGTSETRYKCPNCERCYKNEKNLKRHLRMFHKLRFQLSCSKPNCKFRCRTDEKLQIHQLKHLRESENNFDSKSLQKSDQNQWTQPKEKNKSSNQSIDIIHNNFDTVVIEESIEEILIDPKINENI